MYSFGSGRANSDRVLVRRPSLTIDSTSTAPGSFLGTGPNTVTCSVNAALPIDDAAELTITDASGSVVMAAQV